MRKAAASRSLLKWHVSVPLQPAHQDTEFGHLLETVVRVLEPDVSNMTPLVVVEDRLVGPKGRQYPSSLMVGLLARVLDEKSDSRFRDLLVLFLAREFFPLPVHPPRFPRVRRAAAERAREHRTTASNEIIDATASALCQLEIVRTSTQRPFEREARRQVNEIVTTDFLGPHWRRSGARSRAKSSRAECRAHDMDSLDDGFEHQILSKLYGAELTARARLSKAEAVVVAASMSGYSHAEIAAARGLSSSTVRNQFRSAMRKYRAIFDCDA